MPVSRLPLMYTLASRGSASRAWGNAPESRIPDTCRVLQQREIVGSIANSSSSTPTTYFNCKSRVIVDGSVPLIPGLLFRNSVLRATRPPHAAPSRRTEATHAARRRALYVRQAREVADTLRDRPAEEVPLQRQHLDSRIVGAAGDALPPRHAWIRRRVRVVAPAGHKTPRRTTSGQV